MLVDWLMNNNSTDSSGDRLTEYLIMDDESAHTIYPTDDNANDDVYYATSSTTHDDEDDLFELFDNYKITTIDLGHSKVLLVVTTICIAIFTIMILMAVYIPTRKMEDGKDEAQVQNSTETEDDKTDNENLQLLSPVNVQNTTRYGSTVINKQLSEEIPAEQSSNPSRTYHQQQRRRSSASASAPISIHNHQHNHRASIRSSIRSAETANDETSEVEVSNVIEFADRSTSILQKFKIVTCQNCDEQSQSIWKLAVPFLMQAIISAISEFIQLALVGHQLGTASLSAFVIVELLVQLSIDLIESILTSGNTLISQLVEATPNDDEKNNDNYHGDHHHQQQQRNQYKAGKYLQLSLFFFVLGYTPMIVIWSICMDNVLLFLGYDSEISEIGRQFAIPYAISGLIDGISKGIHYMLDVVGYEKQSAILTTIGEVFMTISVAIYLCCYQLFPYPTLIQMGYLYLLVGILYLVFVLGVIYRQGLLQDYMVGFTGISNNGTFQFSNEAASKLMLSNASMISSAMLLYHGEWQILILFASSLGPAEVAAWGLLGTIWDIAESIIAAVAAACEVRCAILIGSGQVKAVKLLAYKALWAGLVTAIVLSLALWLLSEDIPKLMTHDFLLQTMLSDLIPMICVSNFSSANAIVSDTLLYAQNRFFLATAIACSVTIFVTLPLAALSSIMYNINLQGQMGAVVIGMALTGALTTYQVVKSDWKTLSDAVISAHDHDDFSTGSNFWYDDCYWKNLPPRARQAAIKLRCTKSTWDNDKGIPAEDKAWEDLTTEEQAAAAVLGYNEAKWNREDISSEDS